jgi:putative acetyltransferase
MPASLRSAFPIAVDADLIGEYPAQTKSGGGYFYDAVLEYRVWVHPHDGGEDLYDGDDYYCAFATFEEASAYSRETAGAEQPLVLVRQDECINEPEPGRYEHHTGERLTEWRVEWLEGSKRTPSSIPDFLRRHGSPALNS